jgi:hypothetical protein
MVSDILKQLDSEKTFRSIEIPQELLVRNFHQAGNTH